MRIVTGLNVYTDTLLSRPRKYSAVGVRRRNCGVLHTFPVMCPGVAGIVLHIVIFMLQRD
jgi:hypothetical protein